MMENGSLCVCAVMEKVCVSEDRQGECVYAGWRRGGVCVYNRHGECVCAVMEVCVSDDRQGECVCSDGEGGCVCV